VEQVIDSLISHAIKYAPGARVEVRLEAMQGGVRLTVRTAGVPIAQRDLDPVVTRFERRGLHARYGGDGVGLYLAKHTVQAHGGALYLEGSEGHGTMFVVELPITVANPPVVAFSQPQPEAT
jgi:signal transduction histidine kinase